MSNQGEKARAYTSPRVTTDRTGSLRSNFYLRQPRALLNLQQTWPRWSGDSGEWYAAPAAALVSLHRGPLRASKPATTLKTLSQARTTVVSEPRSLLNVGESSAAQCRGGCLCKPQLIGPHLEQKGIGRTTVSFLKGYFRLKEKGAKG